MHLDLPLLAVGVATGFLSGLVGVGGGFLLVPALVLLGWGLAPAIGTSLAYVTAIGAVGAIAHARRGNLAWRVVGWTALPAIAGAQLGAHLTDAWPAWLVDGIFTALLAFAASGLSGRDAVTAPGETPSPGRAAMVGLGGAVGVLSGLLGVGGGVLLVPGQVRWLRIPLVQAIGNSLAIVFVTGISGTAAHVLRGHVAWGGVGWLVGGGLVGLQGGLLALRRVPVPALQRAFQGLLVALALYMAARGCMAAGLWPR